MCVAHINTYSLHTGKESRLGQHLAYQEVINKGRVFPVYPYLMQLQVYPRQQTHTALIG
jgi:hypothetical protein